MATFPGREHHGRKSVAGSRKSRETNPTLVLTATQINCGAAGKPPDTFGVLTTFYRLFVAAGTTGHDVKTHSPELGRESRVGKWA